ncbi:unnamed protein product, partial [marine sediment metagenome]
ESASDTLAVPAVYRYHYDNDFNYSTYLVSAGTPAIYGNTEEWSQIPNDGKDLQLFFVDYYYDPSKIFFSPYAITGSLFVVSENSFTPQSNPLLGAYINWKYDVTIVHSDLINIKSIYYALYIYTETDIEEISYQITIDPLTNSQEGTFYLPNFDQYICEDGKLRFVLVAYIGGEIKPTSLQGIFVSLKLQGLRVVQEIIPSAPTTGERTLILVHGFSLFSSPENLLNWADYLLNPTVWNYYGNPFEYGNVIVISYYGNFRGTFVTIW